MADAPAPSWKGPLGVRVPSAFWFSVTLAVAPLASLPAALHPVAVLEKVRVTSRAAPVASYTLTTRCRSGLPTAASLGRFPSSVTFVVGGAIMVLGFSVMSPIAPAGVTSWLAASKVMDPARVKSCWPPLLVTKKPSPEIIMSVARPVLCEEPWAKLVLTPATRTPRPICAGLLPPDSPCGAEAPWVICERVSWNWVVEDLKPAVLTLAMLLPVTSSMVWWARRPEIPEYSERSMGTAFLREETGQEAAGAVRPVMESRGMERSPTLTVGTASAKETELAIPVPVVPSASL